MYSIQLQRNGDVIEVTRTTTAERSTNYATYNNSFRPEVLNKDIDRIWLRIQELGVADQLLQIYTERLHIEQKGYIDNQDQIIKNIIVDLHNYVNQQESSLRGDINNLRSYVSQQDNNRTSYFENLIKQQGVSLEQLDKYYQHLLQGIANIAVDKGWLASFITDASGKSQQEINDSNALIDSKLKRENVSVFDFFTEEEFIAYTANPTAYDAKGQVQAFFDYISKNNVGTAYCSGTFYTSIGIIFRWCKWLSNKISNW